MITNPHAEDQEENAMSLKFVPLKPLHLSEEVYQEQKNLLQMNIEKLLIQGRKEQERLREIQGQLEIAEHDQQEAEISRLSQEAFIIKTQLSEITKKAKSSCLEGLQMAPQEKKEWWNLRLERVELELESNGKDLSYWEKILASKEKRDSIQNNRVKQTQAAYDLVSEQEESDEISRLKIFWKTKLKALDQETKHQRFQEGYSESQIKEIKTQSCINEFLQQPLESEKISLATVLKQIGEMQQTFDEIIEESQRLLSDESDAQELFVFFWKRASAVCKEERRRLNLLKQFCEDKNREKEIGVVNQEKNRPAEHEDLILSAKLTATIATKREEQLVAWRQGNQLWDEEIKSLGTLEEETSWRNHFIWWEKQAKPIGLRGNEILIEQLHSKLEQVGAEGKLLYAQANALRFHPAGISLWGQAIQKNATMTDAARELEWEAKRQLQLKADGSLPCNEVQEQKLKSILEKSLETKRYCNLNKGVLQAHKATNHAFNYAILNDDEKGSMENFEKALITWNQSLQEFNRAITLPYPDLHNWIQETMLMIDGNKKMCSEKLEAIQKNLNDTIKERFSAKLQEQKNGRKKK